MTDDLIHAGVKGMRWGHRKSNAQLRRDARNSREKDKRKAVATNRRHIKDADLDKYISRLEKEKKLKDLIDQDTRPGQRFANAVMSDVGRRTITTVAAAGAVYAIRAAIQGDFSRRDLANTMRPRR